MDDIEKFPGQLGEIKILRPAKGILAHGLIAGTVQSVNLEDGLRVGFAVRQVLRYAAAVVLDQVVGDFDVGQNGFAAGHIVKQLVLAAAEPVYELGVGGII